MTAAEGSGKSINLECRKTPRTVSVHSASGGVFQIYFSGLILNTGLFDTGLFDTGLFDTGLFRGQLPEQVSIKATPTQS